MSVVGRLRPAPSNISPTETPTLIDRYLNTSDGARRVAWAGVPGDHPLARVEMALIDTSDEPAVRLKEHASTLWHVLWVRDESGATVTISAPDHTGTWPIAPGDTVPVPRSAALHAPGGQLALAITVPDDDIVSTPPTHGTDRFLGHNRQTTSFLTNSCRVSRWKITQHLSLGAHVNGSCLVMALARDSVIRASSSIDRLRQGEVALIEPQAEPVIMPDGLAYLLTIEQPGGKEP